jgi:hypothetical protein
MTTILLQLSDATTGRECDRIVEQNIKSLSSRERIFLSRAVNNAKRRIKTVSNEKRKSYKLQLN